MNKRRYWYLANGPRGSTLPPSENKSVFGSRDILDWPEEVRRRAVEARVLSIPWWPEAYRWWPEGEDFEQSAPILYTTREAAEDELHRLEEAEPDHYLQAINSFRAWAVREGGEAHQGEDFYNEALSNTEPYRVYGLDADLLITKLEDAEFPLVYLDGHLKPREAFLADLEKEDQ